MAETAVENQICDVCGEEVRAEALFCYNCGSQVRSAAVVEEPRPEAPAAEQPNEVQTPAVSNGKNASQVVEQKPESASAVRRRNRVLDRKPVEVVWTEPQSISKGFVIFTILIAAAAITLLALAMYLK